MLNLNGEGNWNAKYVRNIIWAFLEKLIKFISELLVGFFLARTIGVANFGLFNYAISFVIIFQGVATLGLSEILTREFVNYSNQHGRIIGTALLLRIASAIFFVLVINLISSNEELVVRQIIFIISLSIIFRSFEVLTFYFQSIVKSQKVAKVQIGNTIFISTAKLYFIFSNATIITFAWIYSIECLLISIALALLLFKSIPLQKLRIVKSWSSKLLINSWSLMISASAVSLYMRLDQIMIRQMIDDKANGYYAAALRLTEIWYIIPMILCSTLFPAILNARKRDAVLYNDRFIKLSSFLFWVSFLLAIIISPFAEIIITFLYNESYRPASMILSIQIWSGIFTFLGVSGSYWLMAENLQYISLIRTCIGLAINLILNFMLIPKYGAIGAAIATLITQIFATTISLLLLNKTRALLFIQIKGIIYPIQLIKKFIRSGQ